MSLPRRLEQVGIVVGSVLMLTLPFSIPYIAFFSGSGWLNGLLLYVPGLVVGVLVALDKLPVSYGQVWLFGIASWLATIALWWVFDVGTVWESAALVTWVVALLIGAFVAWAKPHVQFRRSGA